MFLMMCPPDVEQSGGGCVASGHLFMDVSLTVFFP